jgi:hypothetical protein
MINLQIESKSREYFGVVCLHSYYREHITRDLEFEPTPDTALLLKNYMLVFKPVPFGFLVLYNPDTSVEKLRKMPKGLRFSFRAINKNPRLMNITEVPFWPEGQVFQYSNLVGEKEEFPFDPPKDAYYFFRNLGIGNVEKKLLHLPQHQLVGLRSKKFNVELSGDGVRYEDVKIFDEHGLEASPDGVPYRKRLRDANRDLFRRHLKLKAQGLSPEEINSRTLELGNIVEQQLTTSYFKSQVIDLRHAPYGKYTIQWGNIGKESAYITDNPSEKVFGMVDIHFDGGEDALLNREAAEDNEVVRPQMYFMKYEARKTYWRYIFMNYKNSNVSPSLIKDEDEKLEFSSPRKGILERIGTPIVWSESLSPIELKEIPERVVLLERMNGKRNMKEIRLPTPSTDMVKPEKSSLDGYKIYSDILVYL